MHRKNFNVIMIYLLRKEEKKKNICTQVKIIVSIKCKSKKKNNQLDISQVMLRSAEQVSNLPFSAVKFRPIYNKDSHLIVVLALS